MSRALKRVTATGDVDTVGGRLHSVTLTSATGAATLDVRLAGGSGPVVLTLAAAAGDTTATWSSTGDGVPFDTLHATISGTGASASFEVS